MKDYYAILKVRVFANQAEVKAAYRKLVVRYHPDKNPSDEAANLIIEINEAYEILSDPEKKNIYDNFISGTGSEPLQPPRHRDPAYRRRPPNPNFKSKKQQTLEMMAEYLPITLFISRVSFAFFIFIALDYLLPSTKQEEIIVKETTPSTGRYQSSNKKFFTNKGTGFEITANQETHFSVGMPVEITYSSIVHVPTYLESKTTSTTLKIPTSIYGSFIFIPVLLMITSSIGCFYKGGVEFDFNIGITNFLITLFTLIFLFIHKML